VTTCPTPRSPDDGDSATALKTGAVVPDEPELPEDPEDPEEPDEPDEPPTELGGMPTDPGVPLPASITLPVIMFTSPE
jgi:hypothetical protein